MAIKDLVSGAWQDIGTLKVPVSGAYQTASSAKALVSGAWTAVWNSAVYFLKDGVKTSGYSAYGASGVEVRGDNIFILDEDYPSDTYITLRPSVDCVGKKIYVILESGSDTPSYISHKSTNFTVSGNTYCSASLASATSYSVTVRLASYSTVKIKDIYIA